ncbi:T9SS type A sorting domain-containing protein [Pontibacter vulgaris]|uniref:T9SS type A sorting domain-containing protein n=1 Tax=Pontibacter vulgaris TaxID=2905679 RepID=UPI001FA6E721|nr:T9SS type A sorting domain-containing protein [Pontibacter vulgaris]
MKIFTLLKGILICCLLYISLPKNAIAQNGINLPPIEGSCIVETPCLSVRIDEINPSPDNPDDLRLVLLYDINEGGTCGTFQNIKSEATGGSPVNLNTNEIVEGEQFVVLFVNREDFLADPEIRIDAHSRVRFVLPILNININVNIFYDITLVTGLEPGGEPCIAIVPLPVELVYFKGKTTESGVSLEWRTASEIDNKHFEVERSADGKTFEQIAIVEGHGNSVTPINYTLTDTSPLGGTSYYRLKQVDFSGPYEYSPIIAITRESINAHTIELSVAPNPCQNGDCTLSIRKPAGSQETRVQLKDISGRVVYEQLVNGQSETVELPMQDLAKLKGLYILSATSGNAVMHKRVVLE